MAKIRDHSLNSTKNLPNCLCTQLTRRHVDPGAGGFRDAGVILEQLSFVMVNNEMAATKNLEHEKLGGATSSGEFGSILRALFSPEPEAQFAWQRWSGLGKHGVCVIGFETAPAVYTITHDASKRTIHTRARGLIFADRDTRMVMRLHMECDGIPPDFPIQSVTISQDYDFAGIGGQQSMLPLHSGIRSREGNRRTWNQVSYRSYHKYGAESTMRFDTSEQPAGKRKAEKPVKQ